MTQLYDHFAHRQVDPPTSFSLCKIPCQSLGCNHWFCNNASLTKHIQTKHLIPPLQEHLILAPLLFDDAPNPPLPDFDAPMNGDVDDKEDEGGPNWEYHATLHSCFHLPLN